MYVVPKGNLWVVRLARAWNTPDESAAVGGVHCTRALGRPPVVFAVKLAAHVMLNNQVNISIK